MLDALLLWRKSDRYAMGGKSCTQSYLNAQSHDWNALERNIKRGSKKKKGKGQRDPQ